MKQRLLMCLAIAAIQVSSVSASMVRGTITDSATGAPVSNVKVVFYQVIGERSDYLDSMVTGADGRYAFAGPTGIVNPSIPGSGLYIHTIHNEYYFHSNTLNLHSDADTLTFDIRIRRISTGAEAASGKEMCRYTLGGEGERSVASVRARRISLNGRLLSSPEPAGGPKNAVMMVVRSIGAAGRSIAISRGCDRP